MRRTVAVTAGAVTAVAVFAVTRTAEPRPVDAAFCQDVLRVEAIEELPLRITRHSALVKTEAWKQGRDVESIEQEYMQCVKAR